MKAVDTNLLVYAHRPELPAHARAKEWLRGVAESGESWAIPVHCLVEFSGVVSNPRLWRDPSKASDVERQVGVWLESPSVSLLGEGPDFWQAFITCVKDSRVVGPAVHDARIAATCRAHGVKTLWSADRDFGRFRWLEVVNPLVEG